MRIWLGCLAGIFFSQLSNAAELQESWTSARALGMGNAFTAVATEGDALFYNPSALARVSGFHWTIIDPRVGVNGPKALEVASVVNNGGTVADRISDLYGKAVWAGAGVKTSFVMPYLGIAGYGNGDLGLNLQNPAYPQLNANYAVDYGVAVGGAFDLVPSIWSMGITVRRINRTGKNLPIGPATLASLDMSQIEASLKNRGTGYGLDFGTMITLPSPIRPTLAFTIRNVGYTSFTHDEGLAAPPSSEPDMTVGGSLTVDALLVSVTPSFDYRFLDRPDIQTGKKIHLGLEVDLPVLTLRAGLNQGYYTAGVGFDFGVIELEAATYGVEIGEFAGQLEDRRYLAQLKIQLGVDGDFFSFGKSSSASGAGGSSSSSGSRRLKQRR